MQFPDEVVDDVQLRLRRIEGQVRGLQRLLEEGKDCREVVTQVSAVKAALERVGFRLVATGLRYCAADPERAAAEGMDADELEKLFMKLG
jgi:CsoR family transcriptional regulator, copper-sensing transcriptional repressor